MPRKPTPDPTPGQKIHRLTVIEKVSHRPSKWRCLCDCGNESIAIKYHLLNDKHKSCGCIQKEVARRLKTTHGEGGTSLHGIWMNIKSRTTNPNVRCYPRYGGRGIRMDPKWQASFESFKNDVGPRPEGMTLDRIDNDGNYEPGNVRWVPHQVNCRNRSKKTVVTAFGRTLQLYQWTEITGVGPELIRDRMKHRKWSTEDLVATQPNGRRFSDWRSEDKALLQRAIESYKPDSGGSYSSSD
jgi:hypothetical protein